VLAAAGKQGAKRRLRQLQLLTLQPYSREAELAWWRDARRQCRPHARSVAHVRRALKPWTRNADAEWDLGSSFGPSCAAGLWTSAADGSACCTTLLARLVAAAPPATTSMGPDVCVALLDAAAVYVQGVNGELRAVA